MRINAKNLAVALMAITVSIVFVRNRHEAIAFVSTAERIGPGNTPQDMTCGLLTIGICGVTLVAIVRLLSQNRRN